MEAYVVMVRLAIPGSDRFRVSVTLMLYFSEEKGGTLITGPLPAPTSFPVLVDTFTFMFTSRRGRKPLFTTVSEKLSVFAVEAEADCVISTKDAETTGTSIMMNAHISVSRERV